MNYTLYVDDSRIQELGISGLSGFLVHSDSFRNLKQELREYKVETFGDATTAIKWNPPGDDEVYQRQRTMDIRDVRQAVCQIIGKYDVQIMAALIDEQNRQFKGNNPLKYTCQALEFLCQRTQLQMNSLGDETRVIIEVPGSSEGPVCRHYHNIRCSGSNYPNFQLTLNRLDRELLLSHDYLSEGLQIADFCIGAIFFAVKGRTSEYFDLIRHRIRRHHLNA